MSDLGIGFWSGVVAACIVWVLVVLIGDSIEDSYKRRIAAQVEEQVKKDYPKAIAIKPACEKVGESRRWACVVEIWSAEDQREDKLVWGPNR